MIPFTKPLLPDLKVYREYLEGIWQREWITNFGPLVQELEKKMSNYLGIEHLSFVSSGTMALQLTLRNLDKKGQIITSPFSYVATASAAFWEGYEPVFADILPEKFTLDPVKAEALITEKTAAILATHVYGNACEIEAFEALGKKYDIPIFYDGAHCFGSVYKGQSLLTYGNASILSTHATKLFNTVNGGFVVSKSLADKKRIDRLMNFGHDGPNNFEGPGINGKNSEFHAAMGLALLDRADEILDTRRSQWNYYNHHLSTSEYRLMELKNPDGFNASYFPLVCPSAEASEILIGNTEKEGIELRRYFSPSLNTLGYLRGNSCPIAEDISARVICLPLYHTMSRLDQNRVISILKG